MISEGAPLYSLDWEIVNTRIQGGLPQSRRRVLIVGVRKTLGKFQWPDEVVPKKLESVLEPYEQKLALKPVLPTALTQLQNYLALVKEIKRRTVKDEVTNKKDSVIQKSLKAATSLQIPPTHT